MGGFIDKVREHLTEVYRRPEDILRDHRLKAPDRIELLRAWPADDDFMRGKIQMWIQEVEGGA